MMNGRVVKLIIKAPNQQIKDQVVQCDVGWSIGRLKEYLSEVYPSKPESKSQKLIYSGQLLNDSVYLRDVLRQCEGQEDQPYTVHLVCTPQKTSVNKTIKVQAAQNQTAATSTTTNPEEGVTINTASNVVNQSVDSNNVHAQTAQAQLFSGPNFDPHNNQQMAWMQQAYSHYFTQYMQLISAQGIQLPTSVPYIQHMNVNANDIELPHPSHNVNNNNGDEQFRHVPQAGPADNIENIDGAGDEGGLNQDWLDVFYMFSRILLLFSIVYFYSSPLRFFIVTFLGFVIYLYQGGFVRIQPAVQDNNNGRPDNNNQLAQHEVNDAQGAPVQENEQMPTGQNEGRTNPNAVEERPGVLAFAWTFFSSFFASLFPDDPHI